MPRVEFSHRLLPTGFLHKAPANCLSRITFQMGVSALPHHKMLRSIEILATRVVPTFTHTRLARAAGTLKDSETRAYPGHSERD